MSISFLPCVLKFKETKVSCLFQSFLSFFFFNLFCSTGQVSAVSDP